MEDTYRLMLEANLELFFYVSKLIGGELGSLREAYMDTLSLDRRRVDCGLQLIRRDIHDTSCR